MVTFVPTPIGNLEDITYRAIETLKNANTIFCEDSRVTKKLLSLLSQRLNITFNIEKFIPLHSHNEKELLSKIDKDIFNQNVVYVSDAGMPGISDPGFALVKYCQENKIEYDILPGANAALVSFVGSAFCEKEFLFVGFLPHKGKKREEGLDRALNSGYVTIVYESPHRVEKLINQIAKKAPTRKIYAIKEATKLHQKSFIDTAESLNNQFKEINTKGEWSIVIDKGEKQEINLNIDDILDLSLPKKEKAKLLAKITNKSTKEWYNDLLSKES